jgi:alpha-glucosidase
MTRARMSRVEVPRDEPGRTWWRDGVIYHVYPRSFADSDGDGIGDLPGITAHLDHIAWLGVDALWCSPWFPSPNADWGYDVSDYLDVHPDLGTLDDADRLIASAASRGLRTILDIVPNHTSDRHPWFLDARSARDAPHRDWYVWADSAPGGGPPNNWLSSFGTGRPAWQYDDATDQWYLCHFTPEQPDLNWWNEAVREEFDRILRFWFDRGTAGFRIDVCHMIVKDRQLRDNPAATAADPLGAQLLGQVQEFNACRPELHDVLRRWRRIAESYDPPRMLLGETIVFDPAHYAAFWGAGDELNTAYSFLLLHTRFETEALCAVVEQVEAELPELGWPTWPLGNHDNVRFPTRWCRDDPARMPAALVLVLTLRGTPVIYYGDEIGMRQVDVPRDRWLDPVAFAFDGAFGRDGCRTPMQWTAEPGGGFTSGDAPPWLPYGDPAKANVADQREDPGSLLHLTRDLIALRRRTLDLRRGAYRTVSVDARTWVYRRGDHTVVALNLSGGEAAVPLHGRLLLATDRSRDVAEVRGELRLGPWEAAIVDTGA